LRRVRARLVLLILRRRRWIALPLIRWIALPLIRRIALPLVGSRPVRSGIAGIIRRWRIPVVGWRRRRRITRVGIDRRPI
jgi:hypothetical protein